MVAHETVNIKERITKNLANIDQILNPSYLLVEFQTPTVIIAEYTISNK